MTKSSSREDIVSREDIDDKWSESTDYGDIYESFIYTLSAFGENKNDI